jgi:hypothetical protein
VAYKFIESKKYSLLDEILMSGIIPEEFLSSENLKKRFRLGIPVKFSANSVKNNDIIKLGAEHE